MDRYSGIKTNFYLFFANRDIAMMDGKLIHTYTKVIPEICFFFYMDYGVNHHIYPRKTCTSKFDLGRFSETEARVINHLKLNL